MSNADGLWGVALILLIPFVLGYWMGYRGGKRKVASAVPPRGDGSYDEKHILADGLDWQVEIVYVDSAHKESKRRITVHRIYGRVPEVPTYIEGYCHIRKSARTFKVENIMQLTNLATGEIVKNAGLEIAGKVSAP